MSYAMQTLALSCAHAEPVSSIGVAAGRAVTRTTAATARTIVLQMPNAQTRRGALRAHVTTASLATASHARITTSAATALTTVHPMRRVQTRTAALHAPASPTSSIGVASGRAVTRTSAATAQTTVHPMRLALTRTAAFRAPARKDTMATARHVWTQMNAPLRATTVIHRQHVRTWTGALFAPVTLGSSTGAALGQAVTRMNAATTRTTVMITQCARTRTVASRAHVLPFTWVMECFSAHSWRLNVEREGCQGMASVLSRLLLFLL
mmetsp:Transcript_38308/g.76678  ORF Transcript_38308/g.76678 Transcript_38308/m.76678 type:complete len:266 (-) Transcript_38308:1282-2079(-)